MTKNTNVQDAVIVQKAMCLEQEVIKVIKVSVNPWPC